MKHITRSCVTKLSFVFTVISNQNIDKELWDSLVQSCPGGLIYGKSWFLDAIAPGWKVLADDEYRFGLPLVNGQKFGQPFIYQPLFGHKFSMYFRERITIEQEKEFWNSVPDNYRYMEIQLNLEKINVPKKFKAELRTAQVLSLEKDYFEIQKKYHKGLKYSLRKASQKQVTIRKHLAWVDFEEFLKSSDLYRDVPVYEANHDSFMRLISAANNKAKGTLWGAFLPDGTLHGVAYTVEDDHRIYYLFQYSTETGRECCAAHLMTDEIIRLNAGQSKIFDFVGSNVPSIAFFNNQFGAGTEFYQRISYGSKSVTHCLWQTLKSALVF